MCEFLPKIMLACACTVFYQMTLLLLEKDVTGDTGSTGTEKEANISPLDKILPVLSVMPSIIPKTPLQKKKKEWQIQKEYAISHALSKKAHELGMFQRLSNEKAGEAK